MPNEVTDGLAPSMLDSFSGAVRSATYEFQPASEEDPMRETAGSDSHLPPEAWCSRKRTLQAQRAEDLCFLKGKLQTHMSNEATDGLASSVFAFFRELERILAFFRQRAERPEARNCGFGFASCSRNLVFSGGDIAGLNSNTILDSSLE